MIKALLAHGRVATENSMAARSFVKHFGKRLDDGRVQLSLIEALYLQEKGALQVITPTNKNCSLDALLRLAKRGARDFWTSYVVFRDLNDQGYIVKTGLKFGADFRVYTSVKKHAQWIVIPVHERQQLIWKDFASKNRVAHSVNKRVLIAVVDDDEDVSYWDVAWVRRRNPSMR
ncbi:tRNA-intron lyase [Candidatus Woesearchaeota archaeon]|nr:tRNA-intron lyase [Candidatus Woesearchaeota archaeon]